MKRIISLIITLCLVLSSFSYAFATAISWDTSDSQHLTGIYNSLVSSTANGVLKAILQIESDLATYMPLKSDVKTISTTLGQIWSALSFAIDGQYISVFVARIMTAVEGLDVDLSTIVSKLTSINTQTTNTAANTASISSLINGYDDILVDNIPKIDDLSKALTNYHYNNSSWSLEERKKQANSNIVQYNGSFTLPTYNANTWTSPTYYWQDGTPLGNIAFILRNFNISMVNMSRSILEGFNQSQTFTNWNGSTLTTSTFTPTSEVNGIYSWLSNIQTPLARLAFVHASDQEIEARQLAEDNQQAVVDDFIDPSGTGSVGVSDFGSLSDASGAMKTNFNTGQSASGVFNVFNDEHFIYLSQSAADSLDTTGSNTRLLKASGSEYPTPTLDRYYEELHKILEVNTDD